MDGQFGSPSFIPKKPLATRSGSTVNFGGLFLFVSILVFILSVGGYAGLYIYGKNIKTVIEERNVVLKDKSAEKAVTEEGVHNLFNFNNKINIAKDLLALDTNDQGDTTQHTTLSPLVALLRAHTLKTVRFKDFKYTNVDNNKIEIRMSGEAKGYASIALQAKEFEENAVFQGAKGPDNGLSNVVFTDLNAGANKLVVFNMVASVRPALVSYSNMVLHPAEQ